jgi:hypothetical protein
MADNAMIERLTVNFTRLDDEAQQYIIGVAQALLFAQSHMLEQMSPQNRIVGGPLIE